MIKLTKGPEPQILSLNWLNWTAAIVAKLTRGETPSKTELNRYSHSEIKVAVSSETNGKCAYCESSVLHVAWGDIEHIAPKSHDPTVRFRWENLTFACQRCNVAKSDTAVGVNNFVDPYLEDPEDAFVWIGPQIRPKPGARADAAESSVMMMDLNRKELQSKRLERLEQFRNDLDLVSRKPEPLRTMLLENVRAEFSSPAGEYSALMKAHLQMWGL